jgi:hypothetical protein
MELGYKVATVFASLISPLLDLQTKYHNNNKFSTSDNMQHRQPRHLEASISTILVGVNGWYFYGAHLAANLNRALLSIADVMLANPSKPGKYTEDLLTIAMKYKYIPQLLALRSLILERVDFLISVLRFFQVLTDFTLEVTGATPEARAVKEQMLATFQKSVTALTDLAQALVAILTESFMESIESAVELFMMFVGALYNLVNPDGAGNQQLNIGAFFTKFFDQTAKVIVHLSEGLLDMLFKGPFKDIWDALCVGFALIQKACKALTCAVWIPVGLRVSCLYEDKTRCVTDLTLGLTPWKDWTTPPPAPSPPPQGPPQPEACCYDNNYERCYYSTHTKRYQNCDVRCAEFLHGTPFTRRLHRLLHLRTLPGFCLIRSKRLVFLLPIRFLRVVVVKQIALQIVDHWRFFHLVAVPLRTLALVLAMVAH